MVKKVFSSTYWTESARAAVLKLSDLSQFSVIEMHTSLKWIFWFFWFFQGFWVFLISKNISYDYFDDAEFEILKINQ